MKISGTDFVKRNPLEGCALLVRDLRLKIVLTNPEHSRIRPKAKIEQRRVNNADEVGGDTRLLVCFTKGCRDGILPLFQGAAGNPPGATMVGPVSP
jgi:hypothetical protein